MDLSLCFPASGLKEKRSPPLIPGGEGSGQVLATDSGFVRKGRACEKFHPVHMCLRLATRTKSQGKEFYVREEADEWTLGR